MWGWSIHSWGAGGIPFSWCIPSRLSSLWESRSVMRAQPPGGWDGSRGFPCPLALQAEAVQPSAKLAIVCHSHGHKLFYALRSLGFMSCPFPFVVMCNAAVSVTGLFSTESPVSQPLLCGAVHTNTTGLQCCSSHTRLQLALLQIIPGGSCQLHGGRVKAVWVCILILHFLFFRSFEFCCTVWKV